MIHLRELSASRRYALRELSASRSQHNDFFAIIVEDTLVARISLDVIFWLKYFRVVLPSA